MATLIDLEDGPDYKQEQLYQLGKVDIKVAVQEAKSITVGQLSLKFSAIKHYLLDILEDLRIEGYVSFDDTTPPPTTVKAVMPKKTKEKKASFKDFSIVPRHANSFHGGRKPKRTKGYMMD